MTQLSSDADIQACLRGERLYGDNFTAEQIERWYADEKEGYANLGAKDASTYSYPYHAMNIAHGFNQLPPNMRFTHAMGFGGAYGDELKPVLNRIDRITIMDPSDAFVKTEVGGVPAQWVKPHPSGRMPFPDNTFDLITCFGVLHHVPNVSFVLKEMARVLKPGGYALIREPIVSMGDWRQPRAGLTKHERGIPLAVFRDMVRNADLETACERRIVFRPWVKLSTKLGVWPFSSSWSNKLDHFFSTMFLWNNVYHGNGMIDKLRATCIYAVLRKR